MSFINAANKLAGESCRVYSETASDQVHIRSQHMTHIMLHWGPKMLQCVQFEYLRCR